MRAGPRAFVMELRRWSLALLKAPQRHWLLTVGALRNGSDIAGFEPGVSLDHWGSADIAGRLACVAIAALQPDTRGYSIELGGGWVETAVRIL
jgi:hypothetical protein